MHSTRMNEINMSSFPTSSPMITFTAEIMDGRLRPERGAQKAEGLEAGSVERGRETGRGRSG